MKNAIQLVTLRDIEDTEIRELFEKQYEDDLKGSDNYFRYYPRHDDYDVVKGATKKIDAWLEKEGYTIKKEPYFHLLIRWDW